LAGPRFRRRFAAWAGALGLVLLAAGVAWWALRGTDATPAAAVGASGVADLPPSSVAVLPLVNVGHDTASEYFSDGMTDELIGALGGVPGLRVASRTSAYAFKGKEGVDVREIGRQLNVGTVLEGTVRRAGDRVRLTAQLSDTRSGLALWSQSYERQLKDVFAVQDDIARSIVGTLRLKFEGPPGADRRPTGPRRLEAHDLYLRGRHALDRVTEPDLRRSIALFEQAIALDSTYALPWVGITAAWANLADDWVAPREAYPKALAAARRAVALAPDLAEAHAELAGQILQYEWDLDGTQRELDRALALNPNFADAWGWQAQAARARGQLDSAVAYGRRAASLDPFSLWHRAQMIRLLGDAGRSDEAIDVARQVIGIDSSYAAGWIYLADVQLAAGRPAEALAAVQRAGPYGERRRSLLARALAGVGRRDEARRLVSDMLTSAREHYVRPDGIILAYAALGERDSAFAWLDRLVEQRVSSAPFVEFNPAYASLRSDPRFARFTHRVREMGRR
jgi:serine/threonine-protein kinase